MQQLVAASDVLLDPFRPGTLEASGLGPMQLLELNPRLIIARLTGYGQGSVGPLARAAGHDINYVAISGILSLLRRPGGRPQVPLNLLADFSAGSALAVSGVAMALYARSQTGRGGVIDVSMSAGVAYLSSLVVNLQREGLWDALPFLSPGSAPWYDVYATSDDRWVAIGALEPKFFALLLRVRWGHFPAGCKCAPTLFGAHYSHRALGSAAMTGDSTTPRSGLICVPCSLRRSFLSRYSTGHESLEAPPLSQMRASRQCSRSQKGRLCCSAEWASRLP